MLISLWMKTDKIQKTLKSKVKHQVLTEPVAYKLVRQVKATTEKKTIWIMLIMVQEHLEGPWEFLKMPSLLTEIVNKTLSIHYNKIVMNKRSVIRLKSRRIWTSRLMNIIKITNKILETFWKNHQ